jgi:hypothetical protein
MAIEPAKINAASRSTRGTADPQKPIARPDGSADRRRKNHRRSQCLALVPGCDQALGVLEHLCVGRTTGRGFFLRGFAALVFHLATIEAHAPMLDCRRVLSSGTTQKPLRCRIGAPVAGARGPGPSLRSPKPPAMAGATTRLIGVRFLLSAHVVA